MAASTRGKENRRRLASLIRSFLLLQLIFILFSEILRPLGALGGVRVEGGGKQKGRGAGVEG